MTTEKKMTANEIRANQQQKVKENRKKRKQQKNISTPGLRQKGSNTVKFIPALRAA